MSNLVVELLGKDFEFIRIEKIKSKNPIVIIEEGKVAKCKQAIKKLGITTVYTTTAKIDYLSDPVFANTLVLSVHLGTLDYSPIQHLKNLKQLTLTSAAYDYDEADVPTLDLSMFEKLTNLYYGAPNPIENLEKLTKLTKVDISEYSGKDLLVFKQMTGLKYLSLNKPSCTSLNGIQNLNKLVNLTIEGAAHLKSISEIEGLQKLKSVTLSAKQVTDIRAIGSLGVLEKLALTSLESIEDASSLGNLYNLKELSMRGIGQIDSLSFISSLEALKKLYVEPWSVHPKDESYLPLTKKLVALGALKQIIQWEDIYPHLDEEGQKIYGEFFGISKLQFIKREFHFNQYEDNTAPYTKENCTRVDAMIFELIDRLENNETASADEKLNYFKDCLIHLNGIDIELEGFIETGEREYISDTLDSIAEIVKVDLEKFQEMPTPIPSKGGILMFYFDETKSKLSNT